MSMPSSARVPRRPRVLLVDDDAAIRRAVTRLLAQHFDVVAVDGVSAALRYLGEGHHPEGLVVDLYMNEANGRETVARIREVDAWLADRVVVLTTGASDPALLEWCRSLGDAVVHKPASREALVAALRMRIGEGRRERRRGTAS